MAKIRPYRQDCNLEHESCCLGLLALLMEFDHKHTANSDRNVTCRNNYEKTGKGIRSKVFHRGIFKSGPGLK